MGSGGAHKWQGNGYDSDDNSNDFIIRNLPEPQNSFSPTEPREDEPVVPGDINDLQIIHPYTTATSVKLHWTSPANANLNDKAYYDLRYKVKSGDCDLQTDWDNATKIATSSLPVPISSAGQDQIAEITDLSSGVEYCFALMTYNGQHWSNLSNQASGKTSAVPPSEIGVGNVSSLTSDFTSDWGTSTLSWLHTVEAGDEMLFLSAYWQDNNKDVISVKFGDENLTKITGGVIRGWGKTNLSTWYLINPPIGEQKVEVKFTDSMRMAAAVINLSNVDGDNPIATSSFRNFQGEHVLDTINVANNNSLIIDAASVDCGSGALTADPGQTEIFNHRFSYFDGTQVGLSYKKGETAGDYESGWTQTFNNNWTHSLAVINPAP